MNFASANVIRKAAVGTLLLGGFGAAIVATNFSPGSAANTPNSRIRTSCTSPLSCVTEVNSSTGPGATLGSYGAIGVEAVSYAANGLNGTTYATSGNGSYAGVYGADQSNLPNIGVYGGSVKGTGVIGTSNTGAGVLGYSGGSGSNAALVALSPQTLFTGVNSTTSKAEVSIDSSGNEILAGTLTQSGQPLIRTTTSAGRTVAAYGPRTSTPTLEDFGEAQLVNGQAYVALDPTFVSTIDQRARYMVFVSPQGDNGGLYVTSLSNHGFAVRESRAGHSTLTFDYRIIAKPQDTNAGRLAPTTPDSGLMHGEMLVPHVIGVQPSK